MRVQIRRLARRDIDSAFDWYLERDEQAATAFLLEVDRFIDGMRQNCEQFPVVYRDVRRALLKQFPYAIYFKVEGDRVTVVAVPHQRRAPRVWKRRR
jgi:plasmid stabilization system protein ParE